MYLFFRIPAFFTRSQGKGFTIVFQITYSRNIINSWQDPSGLLKRTTARQAGGAPFKEKGSVVNASNGYPLAVILFLCGLLTVGCSKKSDQILDPSDGEKPSATVTIGPSGGVLEMEGISVHIPAGTLDQNTTLTVSESDAENPFGEAGVTGLFLIGGLPDNLGKPLHIRLRIRDGAEVDEGGIAYGLPGEAFLTGEPVTVYSVHAAGDSAGYLVSRTDDPAKAGKRMPASPGKSSVKDALNVLGIGKKTLEYDVWNITYCGMLDPSRFTEELDRVWMIVTGELNLPFQNTPDRWDPYILYHLPYQSWEFPIRIVALSRPEQIVNLRYEIILYNAFPPFFPVLNIDETLLGIQRSADVVRCLGPAVLALSLNTYHPPYIWLNLAVIAWSGEFFSDPDTEAGSVQGNNQMAPFRGMEAGFSGDRVNRHGHSLGMAAVIKYLVDRPSLFGKEGLRRTYDRLLDGRENHNAALLRSIDALPAEWWPDFFKSYIGGEIYGVPPSVFTENASGTWILASEEDEQTTFASDYPDMSAELFLVDVQNPDIHDGDRLIVDVSGTVAGQGLTAMIFAVNGNKLDFLGMEHAASAGLRLTGMKAKYDAGIRRYLVAVVNSNRNETYTGSTHIELTLRHEKAPDEVPGFVQCDVYLNILMEREDWNTYDGRNTIMTTLNISDAVSMAGTFSNNRFEGSRTYDITGGFFAESGTWTDSVALTLGSDFQSILSLDYTGIGTILNKDGTTTHTTRHFTAANIPHSRETSMIPIPTISGRREPVP